MNLFQSLKIIELGGGMAVPLAGMVLADYGADVVKIEPPTGDWARGMPAFQMWNRGKRSVTIDLADSGQLSEAQRLTQAADVVLEGLRTGSATRFGLDYRSICEQNPGVVYCSINGFAHVQTLSGLKSYEACVAAKMGQWVGLDEVQGLAIGSDPSAPIFKLVPINAYGASQLAVQGVIAALLQRSRTNVGQHVHTSLVQAGMAMMMRQDLRQDPAPDRHANDLVHAGIRLTFLTAECSDGRWIQMCARQDHHFRNWLLALGLEDAASDPRYAEGPLRIPTMADIDELRLRICERMRTRTQSAWMRIFIEDYDTGADPVLTPAEFLVHPQVLANDIAADIADTKLGLVRQPVRIARFRDLQQSPLRPAPPLGGTLAHDVWTANKAEVTRRSTDQPRLPLEGVTILEIAYFLAAPLASTILAELGARVIKVEPPAGDPWRRVGLEAVHLLHGKESLAIDLKAEGSAEVLRRLISLADVLLTSFRQGVPERLGFGVERSHEINPSLVYVNATSYGSRGPETHRAAFHSTPNALNGLAIIQAGEGNPPVDDSYPDPCAGLAVGTAIMLGLLARAATGRGQILETTMLGSSAYAASPFLVDFPGKKAPPGNARDQRGVSALQRIYRCSTGWVLLSIYQPEEWFDLARSLGHAEWLDDDRFVTADAREQHDQELEAMLRPIFGRKEAGEWEALLSEAGVPLVKVEESGLSSFLHDHSLLTRASHTSFGHYWRLPARIGVSAPARLGSPASVGEHTEQILHELGFSDAETRRMLGDGVVGCLSSEPEPVIGMTI